jgi:hypothetical protein
MKERDGMASLVEFLGRLLKDGSVILTGRPDVQAEESAQAGSLLARAFADYCLEVAGPPVAFEQDSALRAARYLWLACWFLLHRDEPDADVKKVLAADQPPRSAAEHLSADLVLRFLPQVHRRARAVDAADVLTRRLEDLLRQYPLTGALADVEEGPLNPPEFENHPGLLLLYAERLAEHPRPAWLAEQGPAREYAELVWAERGLSLPAKQSEQTTEI